MILTAKLINQYNSWIRSGTLVSEMESATLFIVANYLKVQAGAIILVASNKWMNTLLQDEENQKAMDGMIEYTLNTVGWLEKQRTTGN